MTTFLTPLSADPRQPHAKKSRHRLLFAVTLSASLFATAITPAAEAAGRQPEGSHAWKDGWCYVVSGGQWVRDGYSRSLPDRNNAALYDLYYNGQYVKRVDVSTPGWTKELIPAYSAPSSAISWYMFPNNTARTEANIYYFIKAFNRFITLPQLKATVAAVNRQGAPAGGTYIGGYGGSTSAGTPSSGVYVGGGTGSTPNTNPLTVDSVNAERARQSMSPAMQEQMAAVDRAMHQINDNAIKVGVLGSHVYVRR